jgi:hypothetical protein
VCHGARILDGGPSAWGVDEARSRWPGRLLLLGALLLLAGFVTFGSMGGILEDAFDPRISHVASVESGGEVLEDLRPVCHALYVVRGVEVNATLERSDGWSTSGTPLNESACRSEWQPMSADGVDFVRVAAWSPNEAGPHLLRMEGDEGVEAWLVDLPAMEQGMFESPWIIAAFGMCVFGLVVLPIGLVLMMGERRRRGRGFLVVDGEGGVRPLTMPRTEEEAKRFFEDLRGDGLPFDPVTGTYRTEQQVRHEEERASAPEGMLTTEQVYALMRGDLEGAMQQDAAPPTQTRDPFVRTSRSAPAPQHTARAPTESSLPTANTDWQAWDDGD